jgi:hypothetical protein
MGFALTGNGRLQVRPVLTALLSDESTDVRIKVACRFAAHRDAVCARTLLDLVHGGCLDYDRHSRVVSAVANLSGIHFDYGPGPNGWRITTEKNKEALRRFIEWVENIERKES